jgi:uncharacterized membrane protein YhaH (DUF805 family)
MDIRNLFTAPEGRIGRTEAWIGAIVLVGCVMGLWLVINVVFGQSVFGRILEILTILGFFYPAYAVTAKRFQDVDKPSKTALYGLVPLLVAGLLGALGLTETGGTRNALGWICVVMIVGVIIWFVVELGLFKGTTGSNRYGLDPRAHR